MNDIDKNNLPRHIAIVPDGNRRWAEKKNQNAWRGHLAGAKITEKIVREAFDLGIECLSLWGGSWSNLTRRSKKEVNGLFIIYERYFNKLSKSKDIYKNEVKVNVIGRWEEVLPKSGIKAIKNIIKKTKDHTRYKLNFFIAYNGTDEMIAAIKNITKEARANKKLRITPKVLESNLWTHDLPPVDLLIRTGSNDDPHNSVGFMMWHTANTQYYFTNICYPDFDKNEFKQAINDFIQRQRRFGK